MTVGMMFSLFLKLFLLAATFTILSVLTENWWKAQYTPGDGPLQVRSHSRWTHQRKSA